MRRLQNDYLSTLVRNSQTFIRNYHVVIMLYGVYHMPKFMYAIIKFLDINNQLFIRWTIILKIYKVSRFLKMICLALQYNKFLIFIQDKTYFHCSSYP